MAEIVECHSEYAYAEKPVALTWEGKRREVAEILRRWCTPGVKCFRIKTTDGELFEIFYGEIDDEWRIQQL